MGIIAQLRFADSCSGSAVPSGRGRHTAFPVPPRPGTGSAGRARQGRSLPEDPLCKASATRIGGSCSAGLRSSCAGKVHGVLCSKLPRQGAILNEVLLVGLGAVLGWAATYFLPGFWAKVARRPPLRIHVEPDPKISMAAYRSWDGYSFHIPRRIDEIGEPPGPVCREWWTWAHGMEGMDAGYTHVRLMVTGLSDMDVVVDALQVRVLDRYDAPAGTTIICATGGADLVPRHIDVDLDHEPPLTEYRDSGGDPTSRFLFTLRKGETEVSHLGASDAGRMRLGRRLTSSSEWKASEY